LPPNRSGILGLSYIPQILNNPGWLAFASVPPYPAAGVLILQIAISTLKHHCPQFPEGVIQAMPNLPQFYQAANSALDSSSAVCSGLSRTK